jgi:hypothetical protein
METINGKAMVANMKIIIISVKAKGPKWSCV